MYFAEGTIKGVENDVIAIPVETWHPQVEMPGDINATDLPSGQNRERLHRLLGVHQEGVKVGANVSHIETPVKLGATAQLVLPSQTALKIISGFNVNTGGLVDHLDSDLLLSDNLSNGKRVTHSVITETEGEIPTHILCQAYRCKVMPSLVQ